VIRVGVNYEGRDPRFVETVIPSADVVEVTPDSLATLRDGRPVLPADALRELREIAARVPVTLHGIGLSIASAGAMNAGYLGLADSLLQSLDIAWHSEHLGYVEVDGEHLGTMLVAPRTEEALALVCARVAEIQARWTAPFLLEHAVNLFPDPGGDYTAAGFLNEIVRRTSCGLLLDLYNLECDGHNGAGDVDAFLAELDLDAVREIHVARGAEERGLQLDVHSRVAGEATLALLRRVLSIAPNVEAVIFELVGPAVPVVGYDVIVGELQRIRDIVRSAPPAARPPRVAGRPRPHSGKLPLHDHQRAMRDLLRGRRGADDPYVAAAAASAGLEVMRDIVRGWRRLRLDRHCRLTAAMLKRTRRYAGVLHELERGPVSPYIEAAAESFLDAARACGDPLVASVAEFERALLRGGAERRTSTGPAIPTRSSARSLAARSCPTSSPRRTAPRCRARSTAASASAPTCDGARRSPATAARG
jgi:hypothetical protein